jgi:hypothetical protein
VRYTAHRKLALLAAAKRLQGEGRLPQSAADKLHVSIANLSRWAVQKIDKVNPMDLLFTKKIEGSPSWPIQPVDGNRRTPATLHL